MAVDAVPGHGRGPGPRGTRNAPLRRRLRLATVRPGPPTWPGTRSRDMAGDHVPRLARAVQPVAGVAEAGDDEASLVEAAVDGGRDDVDVRMLGVHVLDS